MSSRVRFFAVLATIFAAVPLAWWWFLREPAAAPTTEPVAARPMAAAQLEVGARTLEVRLGETTGHVELRKGVDGGWQVARPGDALEPKDGVRTGDGSTVVLVGGETWQVKMEPGTEVGIGELSESITRLLLETGMARAQVLGGQRHVFEVRASNTDAQASTDAGVFTIASNGQGTVAVATERGEVLFSGGGRVVIVREGQQALKRPGQPPGDPAPIPSSLLLKVALPARRTINTPRLVLKGSSEPGALVEVQGRVVRVDEDGRFEAAVQLREGLNQLDVRARGVGGKERASAGQVELDTTVRPTTMDGDLWKDHPAQTQ